MRRVVVMDVWPRAREDHIKEWVSCASNLAFNLQSAEEKLQQKTTTEDQGCSINLHLCKQRQTPFCCLLPAPTQRNEVKSSASKAVGQLDLLRQQQADRQQQVQDKQGELKAWDRKHAEELVSCFGCVCCMIYD